jgi:LysR family transcriptional regulator, regulator for bpeEF and oprC
LFAPVINAIDVITKLLFELLDELEAAELEIKQSQSMPSCVNFVLPQTRREIEWKFEWEGAAISLPIDSYLQFDYAEASLMAACQGAGIIQAPKYIVTGAIARGELQPILTEFRSPESKPIAIVYPQKKYLSAKVRVFIDFMTALMGHLKRDGIVD